MENAAVYVVSFGNRMKIGMSMNVEKRLSILPTFDRAAIIPAVEEDWWGWEGVSVRSARFARQFLRGIEGGFHEQYASSRGFGVNYSIEGWRYDQKAKRVKRRRTEWFHLVPEIFNDFADLKGLEYNRASRTWEAMIFDRAAAEQWWHIQRAALFMGPNPVQFL